jgi:hypothetical protein
MTDQRQTDRIAERLENMTLIQERMLGRLEVLEKWKDSEERAKERAEDRRDDRIDSAPANTRNMLGTYGGCIANVVYALLTLISLMIGTVGLIIAITKH